MARNINWLCCLLIGQVVSGVIGPEQVSTRSRMEARGGCSYKKRNNNIFLGSERSRKTSALTLMNVVNY
jgi:hypothetical protein